MSKSKSRIRGLTRKELQTKLQLRAENIESLLSAHGVPSLALRGKAYSPAGYRTLIESRLQIITRREAAFSAYKAALRAEREAQAETDSILQTSDLAIRAAVGPASQDLPSVGIAPAKERVRTPNLKRSLRRTAVQQNREACKAANRAVLSYTGDFAYNMLTGQVVLTGTNAAPKSSGPSGANEP